MRVPLSTRISRWFRTRSRKDFCEEDPMKYLEALSADLWSVREEYDRVVAEYRRAMNHLHDRLRTTSPIEAVREGQHLQEIAEGLRRAAQRLEASFRETGELEQELREWEMRAGEPGVRNADHPDVRAEILRSELALRRDRGLVRAILPEQSPFQSIESTLIPAEDRHDAPKHDFLDAEPIRSPDAEHLLVTIRHVAKEIEQWHEQASVSDEACDDVHRLRGLHAALRRIDHAEGVVRDRVAYAVRMR